MSLSEFSRTLYQSDFSTAIRSVDSLIPAIQSIHIVALAMLFGIMLILNFRLLGVIAKEVTPAAIISRHSCWFWIAFGVLVITGFLMTVAEPNRVITNTLFWSKMGLIVAALVLFLVSKRSILAHDGAKTVQSSSGIKIIAVLSLCLWLAIMWCGRWIAYAGS